MMCKLWKQISSDQNVKSLLIIPGNINVTDKCNDWYSPGLHSWSKIQQYGHIVSYWTEINGFHSAIGFVSCLFSMLINEQVFETCLGCVTITVMCSASLYFHIYCKDLNGNQWLFSFYWLWKQITRYKWIWNSRTLMPVNDNVSNYFNAWRSLWLRFSSMATLSYFMEINGHPSSKPLVSIHFKWSQHGLFSGYWNIASLLYQSTNSITMGSMTKSSIFCKYVNQ